MKYKHFYLAIILRFSFVIAFSIAGTYFFFEKQAYVLSALAFVFLVGSVFNIINYFNNLNRWIGYFLLGVENEDTSLKMPTKSGNKAIDDVYNRIDRLNQLFKQTKVDISTQEQYYRSVMDQSSTGLFSVNEKGRVININPAAIKMTNLQNSHHINSLKTIDPVLPDFIMNLERKPNQQSTIFENQYGQKLFFKLSEIKTSKETIRLVAVSDITKELDNGEVDAWIKLARTLSHEIMNNITPITTLSKVVLGYFINMGKAKETTDIDSKTISNTIKGLTVIEERSLGLMNFVENYRKFTKLPEPKLSQVNVSSLIEHNLLAASTFPNFSTIELVISVDENLRVSADEKLLSQVIINLLKNACEALYSGKTENPKISIRTLKKDHATQLKISNNGPAIPVEIREQIFTPFFTTKDQGSGVGLSLSKQIMLKMNGDVLLNSRKEKDTTFTVVIN
jgi:nitrogen fixation/metabolism regulation signal transduction histidine kinase